MIPGSSEDHLLGLLDINTKKTDKHAQKTMVQQHRGLAGIS